MTLLGDAAVAMWWNVADDNLTEFHDWHSREHLPERLAIPGFNRGSRWQRENAGEFFVIYELAAYETLVSEPYRQRLDNPTPWSEAMMPRHLDMVRSQCRLVASHGRGVATYMTTLRLSPREGEAERLEAHLKSVLAGLVERSGVTGAHLLRTETPSAAPTREQRIRGGDAVADWIVLVSGHDAAALRSAGETVLATAALHRNGAGNVVHGEPYRLVHALTAQDVRGPAV